MSILDRILGRQSASTPDEQYRATPRPDVPPADEQAVDRYRYLLRTAPPETIEQVHAEAFAQLTPAQRRLVLEGLNGDLPPQERADRDDPQSLARLATRTELRRPGTLERTLGGIDPRGAGGLLGGNFLNTVAAVVVGTAITDALFADGTSAEGDQAGAGDADAIQDAGFDGSDAGYDTSGDLSIGDLGGGEF